jgi:hypothetical protein
MIRLPDGRRQAGTQPKGIAFDMLIDSVLNAAEN